MKLINETRKSQGASSMFFDKNWKMAVSVFGIIVALITLYFLILPGVSMEKDSGVLDCQLQIHQHEDGCYDENGDLQCGLADFVVHSHSDGCYDSENNLICTLEEIEEHTHDDECYQVTKDEKTGEEAKTLVCHKAEIELHEHDEKCYEKTVDTESGEVTEKLICGKLEVKAHEHGQGCFITDKTEENTEEKEGNSDINEDNAAGNSEGEAPEGENAEELEAEGTEAVEGNEGEKSEDGEQENASALMAPRSISDLKTTVTSGYKVDVEKTWAHGNNQPQSVTVELKKRDANGNVTSANQTMTLSANSAQPWKGTFTINDYDDSYEYFVEEVSTPGMTDWVPHYQASEEIVSETWTKVPFNSINDLAIGGTYAFLSTDEQSAYSMTTMTLGGSKVCEMASISRANGELVIPLNARWIVENGDLSSNRTLLNDGIRKYLDGDGKSTRTSGSDGCYYPHAGTTQGSVWFSYVSKNGPRLENGREFSLYRLSERIEGQRNPIVNAPRLNSDADINQIHLEHKKQIDYLGDGESNPDTNVTGDDLYRLYLDVKGTKDPPIDLLIVIDRSGSMTYPYGNDMPVNENDPYSKETRAQAINRFLNGSDGKSGFIDTFLASSEDNRISVVDFGGTLDIPTVADDGYAYTQDSLILRDWGRDNSTVVFNADGDGTNYSAGLKSASSQFDKLDQSPLEDGKNHRKMLVFLSDGQPTFFIDDDGNRQGNGEDHNNNEPFCKEPSRQDINDFINNNPDVMTHSVGFYGTSGANFDTDLLEYLASQGGGSYNYAGSAQALTDLLIQLTMATKASITDSLSFDVEYCQEAEQNDLKFTMKEDGSNQEIVLYENGQVTQAGSQILDNITFIPGETGGSDNGKVVATFKEAYGLDPNTTYTLSYNVEVTQKAYDDYIDNGGNYGGVTGDSGTDYGNNTSSSGQPGFHSNEGAHITYTVNGEEFSEEYDHPVVQVSDVNLKLVKKKMDKIVVLPNAVFTLYRPARTDEQGVELNGQTGLFVAVDTLTTDAQGKASSIDISPGDYYLVETQAPPGHKPIEGAIKIRITKKVTTILTNNENVIHQNENDETEITVLNVEWTAYELPETGGIGVEKVEALGVVLMLAAVMWVFRIRRREKRDSG